VTAADSRVSGSLGTVLHVVSSNALAGTERHVLGLSRELRNLDCDAWIVCRRSATLLADAAKQLGIPVAAPAAAARARAAVVHAHDGRSALVSSLLSMVGNASLIRTQHFVRPASVNRRGGGRHASVLAHRLLNRRFDGYIAVSEASRAAALQRHETGRAQLAVIPPGIELPSPEAVDAARTRREESMRAPVVVSAGRLERERRFDVLLSAIPLVRERFPTCRIVIAGSGSAEQQLRRLAEDLGVAGSVTWTGWITGIEEVLGEGHVYVNTWPWEGFGMATAEAMAFELPVIVTTSGASAELVEGGAAGAAVPPCDPRRLAETICELLTNRARASELGRRARARAESYSIRSTAVATLEFYLAIRAPAGGRQTIAS